MISSKIFEIVLTNNSLVLFADLGKSFEQIVLKSNLQRPTLARGMP